MAICESLENRRDRSRPRPTPFPHRVVAIAYDRLCTFEFGIAVEMFGLPRPEFDAWYDFAVCAAEPGPLRALQQAHKRGARLLSFCSGAFVFAEAGLLGVGPVATHWRYADLLAQRYPEIKVDADVLYVDAGSVLTSAGSASGIDLCLHVIRQDFGVDVANEVARRLVVPPHREGGQSQFIKTAVTEGREPGRIVAVMDWARSQLQHAISFERLAKQANMSPRTFARQFRAATGTTPHRWLSRERVLAAQELLESTDHSIDEDAGFCGMGSAPTLRHHFSRMLGVSPAAYRATFGRPQEPVTRSPKADVAHRA